MLPIGRFKKWLGISVGERGMSIADVRREATGDTARSAEFVYSNGASPEQAETIGRELGKFLERHGFSAREVVFGVPAKWLILKSHTIPPTDGDTAANMVWMHATEKTSQELGPMVFDYVGQSSLAEPSTMQLVGLQRRWIDWLRQIASAARLKILSIVPTGAALAAATAPHEPDGLILWLRGESAELIAHDHGRLKMLRHIGSLELVRAELRRTSARRLVIWDNSSAENATIESFEIPAIRAAADWVNIQSPVLDNLDPSLAAIALTMCARDNSPACLDFLHPRLKAPKTQTVTARRTWLYAASAIVVALILGGVAEMLRLNHQIAVAESQLQEMQPALAKAKPFLQRMQFAESFRTGKPRYLACIADLTTAIESDSQTYYVSFDLHTDMKGEITGKTASEKNVLDLVDKLRAGGRFNQLNPRLDARGTHGSEVSFALSFSYVPGA